MKASHAHMPVSGQSGQSAFAAGVEEPRRVALAAAEAFEVRDDGREVRQQAAAAALRGLAEGLRILASGGVDPIQNTFAAIAAKSGDSGAIECPTCKGRLLWIRDSFNGHLHSKCETDGCLRWM